MHICYSNIKPKELAKVSARFFMSNGTAITSEATINNKIIVLPCNKTGLLQIISNYEMWKIEVTNKAAQLLLKQLCSNKSVELHLKNFSEDVCFVTVFCLNGIRVTKKVIFN